MTPTIYGLLVLIVGGYLMTRPMVWMLVLFLVTTLFGAASAVDLPLLGGASVQPSLLVLVMLGIRLALAKAVSPPWVGIALRENALLLAYCVYAAVTAFILPKIFFHRIALMPMATAYLGPQPLNFSSQNITTAFYLIGTGFAAVVAAIVAQDERSAPILVSALIVVTWVHVLFGIADLGLSMIHQEKLLLVFRNGHYEQVDQNISTVHRIAGIMVEPSSYASYGCVLAAFMAELWWRGIAARLTGPAALAMLIMIILCTATTGYLAIGIYGLILAVRMLLIPGGSTTSRALTLGLLALAFATLAIGILIFDPATSEKVGDVMNTVLFTKAQTDSGVQRAEMARQGMAAFAVSGGFGVGAGSFRSSGMFTSILGSVGVIGASLFVGYALQVIKPLRPSTYRVRASAPRSLGAAAAWAALISIVASGLGAASPDPGALFAVLAGLSLAWSLPQKKTAPRPLAVARSAAFRPFPTGRQGDGGT